MKKWMKQKKKSIENLKWNNLKVFYKIYVIIYRGVKLLTKHNLIFNYTIMYLNKKDKKIANILMIFYFPILIWMISLIIYISWIYWLLWFIFWILYVKYHVKTIKYINKDIKLPFTIKISFNTK
jgi:hypothetical protein